MGSLRLAQGDWAPNTIGLTYAMLRSVDELLRKELHDDGRDHYFALYRNGQRVADILGRTPAFWKDWNGVTAVGVSWDEVHGRRTYERGDTKVDISLVKLFPDVAVTVGLVLHELSHASGAQHEHADEVWSTAYWEALGQAVWRRQPIEGSLQRQLHGCKLAAILRR